MIALFLVVFVDLLGFGIIIPLLPFYAEHFHATPVTVAALMAVYSLAQFLTAPLLGSLSDRVGRRRVIALSLCGIALAYLAMAFAASLALLFASRALAGAFAGNIAAAQAYVADQTSPADRARGMGVFGAAFSLGFVLGPMIGGLLAEVGDGGTNFMLPPLVAAGTSATAMVLALLMLKPGAGGAAARPALRRGFAPVVEALRSPALKPLAITLFLITAAFAGMEATFALWTERALDWGPRQVGMMFAYAGAIAALVQGGLIGRLTPRFGEERILRVGVIILIGGFALLPLSGGAGVLLVAMTLFAAGFGLTSPSLHSLISRHAASDAQGATLGVAQSASSLARIIGPIFAGIAFSAIGRDWPYFLGALVLVGVAIGLARRARAPVSAESGD